MAKCTIPTADRRTFRVVLHASTAAQLRRAAAEAERTVPQFIADHLASQFGRAEETPR